MSARHFKAALVLAGAGLILAPVISHAQTVLSDYESSDQAQKARANALRRLAFRPTQQVLEQTVASLRGGAKLTPEDSAKVDALLANAAKQSPAEARRSAWQAVALVLGRPWTPAQEMIGALTLKTAEPVVSQDQAKLELTALYPVTPPSGARYAVSLTLGITTSSATPQRGAVVRELAAGSIGGALPQSIGVNFKGVPDGFYLLTTTITAPDGTRDELATPFTIIHGLAERRAAMTARLSRIKGHDAAKQTAEYPFALAQAINAGTREVISYDFKAALARSEAIADALAKGKDPVAHATGLQNRAYRFAETGELIPYQLFVPSNWTPDRRWPLVVALHGANLDETNMLGRAGGRMQQLAEQHGMIVLAPLGYRINSAYGAVPTMGRLFGADAQRVKRSEADVLAVTDRIAAEYHVDPARRYLTGNSMGGGGTWWIGGHYSERWAAIAPAAIGGVIGEDVAGLAHMPIMAVVGDRDELGMLNRMKADMAMLHAKGIEPTYVEIKGGTHSSAFDTAMPQIFDFFESHRK